MTESIICLGMEVGTVERKGRLRGSENTFLGVNIYSVLFFLSSFFGYTVWLLGSQVPNEWLDTGHGSESAEF